MAEDPRKQQQDPDSDQIEQEQPQVAPGEEIESEEADDTDQQPIK
ncbi:MAG TPA: hypothetical protein VGT02_13375 [Methylomirabilota bacterium]|jgi:hypothetical protein|nr:hypothetical protein [Methylomirabilota bacterium]